MSSKKMSQKSFFEELATLNGKFRLDGSEIRTKYEYKRVGQGDDCPFPQGGGTLCPIEAVYFKKSRKVTDYDSAACEMHLAPTFTFDVVAAADFALNRLSTEKRKKIRRKMLCCLGLKEKVVKGVNNAISLV